MEKIELGTPDITQENIDKLGELFPQVLTEIEDSEGKVQRSIDFDALKCLLGDVAEDQRERYQFNWPGKREAKAEARRAIHKTMVPSPEKSVGWDDTENLYIEGDNLDSLKVIRQTYAGKIKMVYIDPPYNTGSDFVYDDDFAESATEYHGQSGDFLEGVGRLVTNLDTNGRFHSDWCSMIYPRLLLAKDLLTHDGVIFISIDDNEVRNLRNVCDEVFGAQNHLGTVIWERAFSPKNDAKYFSSSHDYVVAYAKNISCFEIGKLPRTQEMNERYKNPDNDPRGPWQSGDLTAKTYSAAYDYPVTLPSGRVVRPTSDRAWITSRDNMERWIEEGRIWFGANGDNTPRFKRYLSDMTEGIVPTTLWKYSEVGHSQEGRQELKNLFDGKGYFDGPKPVRLIDRLLTLANLSDDDTVLDFFSGSATTAHAVMRRNAECGSHNKFILVQVPEETDVKRDAYKDGYPTICEIGEERIRRAGSKIADEIKEANRQLKIDEEPRPVPDIGFRVLKVDSSNFKNVNASSSELVQESLLGMVDNVKEGRTDLDLLFEVLPKFRIPYSVNIEERLFAGKKCFIVDEDEGLITLIACFDANVSADTIKEIARLKPVYVAIRNSSMIDDSTYANFEELFKTYSPGTIRRVI